jgi:hypothetical protein
MKFSQTAMSAAIAAMFSLAHVSAAADVPIASPYKTDARFS